MKEKNIIPLKEKKHIAFVASGGAIKAAAYHLGVALALKEFDFNFPGENNGGHRIKTLVGSSAGSAVTAFLTSFKIEDVLRVFGNIKPYALPKLSEKDIDKLDEAITHQQDNQVTKGSLKKLSYVDMFNLSVPSPKLLVEYFSLIVQAFNSFKKHGFFGLESVIHDTFSMSGLFSTEGIQKYFEQTLPCKDFTELRKKHNVDLFLIATELDNPRKVIFGPKKTLRDEKDCWQDYYSNYATIPQAIACSTCLPLVYKPYKIQFNGKPTYYIDGEIKKTLSTHVAKDNGADLIIVSYTHNPYSYEEGTGSLAHKGLLSVLEQSVYQVVAQKIQNAKQLHLLKEKIAKIITDKKYQQKYNLPQKFIDELTHDIYEAIEYNPNVHYIVIPSPNSLFFKDHFNLTLKEMLSILKIGYVQARKVLKTEYKFQ